MTSRLRRITSYAWVTQSSLYDTNSGIFLFGDAAFLVDPGVRPAELEGIAAFLAERRASVRAIVLTHAHWDHLLGPERFPQATVVAHDRYPDVIEEHRGDLRRQVMSWASGTRDAPFEPPLPDVTFADRLSLHLGSFELRVLFAPGHAPDHCVLYEPEAGLLWAGDMLSDREVPMPMDSFASYLHALDVLSAKQVDVLVPGHGSPTADPREIHRRFEQDRAYLQALQACVSSTVSDGADLDATLAACRDVPFAQPDTYPHAHRWNIEQAYLELGGEHVPDRPVGWAQDWL
ncbi:MAG: MBL fold metallo-hydrolase [Anaerolineae bacterium]